MVRRLAIALFVIVVVTNAWADDDVWITMRAVDNFIRGYGLGWNAYERVQVFTHPLWMLLLSAGYFVTREGYWTVLALSFACTFGMLPVVLRRWREAPWRVLAWTAVLVSSKAFVDYATSGLENPLSNLLATVFFVRLLDEERSPMTERRLFTMISLASVAYFNRADATLVYVPALFWLTARSVRVVRFRIVRAWVLGTLPASLWTLFALVYFGFPVPNTAFAKLAGGHYHAPFFHPHGREYYSNSFRWDPVTLIVIGGVCVAGLVVSARRRRPAVVAAVIGIVLLLLYVLRIGGDYMSGRLFVLPLVVATMLLVELLPRRPLLACAAVAFVVGLAGPRSPILSRMKAGELRDKHGVLDDHRMHAPVFALPSVLLRHAFGIGEPRQILSPDGLEAQAVVWGATGAHGFLRGPLMRTIDFLALSDPLLARLPPMFVHLGWGRGHLGRLLPEGYLTSVEIGQNRIVDPSLRAYYDELLVITTGPIFDIERARTIWKMNTGQFSHWLDEYAERHPMPP